ncbi:MAG: amidohydrolase family protein [Chloroflexota bacterium]
MTLTMPFTEIKSSPQMRAAVAVTSFAPTHDAIIDGDIHNYVASPQLLFPYLAERWQRRLDAGGIGVGIGAAYPGGNYPKHHPYAARVDAWPPGKVPGADLDFMRKQLLDEWNIAYGVLNTLHFAGQQRIPEYAQALATALNDWQVEHWLDPEPRLRAAIIAPFEDGDAGAAEVERCARDKRFVQVLVPVRTQEPLGRRKYWPMYEAAERNGLPIAIHFGGSNGWPITGAGWPSFYIEDHAGMAQSFQSHVISLVCEGVFERFPALKVVLVEGGFAWLAPLMWRLDQSWKRLRDEVPHVTRLPSETIREHFWFTTQPIEEPPKPLYFKQLLEQLDMNDRILFATDYPHWDFDAPDQSLPTNIAPALRRQIMSENARALYGFE